MNRLPVPRYISTVAPNLSWKLDVSLLSNEKLPPSRWNRGRDAIEDGPQIVERFRFSARAARGVRGDLRTEIDKLRALETVFWFYFRVDVRGN